MRVLVLGSGVIGTTSAWYLRQAGFEVTVIDRQPGPALETSFAVGGPGRAEEGDRLAVREARTAGDQAGHGPGPVPLAVADAAQLYP